jgi:hypothetical protein
VDLRIQSSSKEQTLLNENGGMWHELGAISIETNNV